MRSTASVLGGALVLAASALPARADDPKPDAARLTLTAEARVVVPADGPATLHVKAQFKNGGTKPLTFFVPESFGVTHFPRWRLVREDGAAFVPYDAPYQSMWTEGIQGSLPELAPGKSWEVEHDVDLVIPAEKPVEVAELTPLPLEPGRYRVECTYEKPDARVPVGGKDFELSAKTVPDLWTGKAEATAVTVDVPRPKIVSLRIDAAKEAVVGKPYPVTVTLRNDREKAATLEGAFTVSVSSKPQGTAGVRLRLAAPTVPLPVGATQSLTLAPGEVRTFTFDLAAQALVPGQAKAAPTRLADFVRDGIFALDASFGHPDASATLTSNLLWRYVKPAPSSR